MDTALPQKFPFILDRNLAKANCTENRVCMSCDTVVLGLVQLSYRLKCHQMRTHLLMAVHDSKPVASNPHRSDALGPLVVRGLWGGRARGGLFLRNLAVNIKIKSEENLQSLCY